MLLFLKFLLAHILGDFVLQSNNWVKNKEEKKIKSSKLYLHIGIHAILLLIILQFNLKEYWLGFAIIVISHYLFDVSKLYLQKKKTKRTWFFIDQVLHLLALIFVTSIYTGFNIYFNDIITSEILLLLISLLMVTSVSAIIIKVFITQWNPERKLTEYILIGTLLSFGLAIIIGILYSYLKSII